MSKTSIGQSHSDKQDNLQPSQCTATGDGENAAYAAVQTAQWQRIPQELKQFPQWVLAGPDKQPLTAKGQPASVTNRATWCDFDTARQAAAKLGYGIGFVLTADDPYSCIDLDVKDDTPQQAIDGYRNGISNFDSYAERSQSGNGFHIWIEGNIGKGCRKDRIEVYSQERYIICTGNVVLDRPIAARPEQLAMLLDSMRHIEQATELPPDNPNGNQSWYVASQALNEDGSFKDNELGRLFQGDWQGRYKSQSEADLALVTLLGRHTESNSELWAAFQISELGKRDKARRPDYMRRTIERARQHLANDAARAAEGRAIAESMLRPAANPRRFPILRDDDLRRLPRQKWMVKHIIPDNGVGTIYGPSQSYKSFLALDLLAHIANGQYWFGQRVTAAPAIYVPFEGKGGIPKRVDAWRLAMSRYTDQEVASNIAFITVPINLRKQADRDKLVTTLLDHELTGGVLCIDTLAQAGQGIDENSSEMSEMIAIFQELQYRLGGVVLVIHHTGKDESKEMRGWSGLPGAMDFSIKCERSEKAGKGFSCKFIIKKEKDEESGREFGFSMLRIHLSYDEDGDEISSLTVCPTDAVQPTVLPKTLDAERDAADDKFIWEWAKSEVEKENFPSKNSLESQLADMKPLRAMTQKRVRDSVHRLMAESRLVYDDEKSPSGNKWIRAVEQA